MQRLVAAPVSLVWYSDVDVSCRYSMLKIALGAEFNSEKMFKDVAELASKYKGVQLHTHVAENPVWSFVWTERKKDLSF